MARLIGEILAICGFVVGVGAWIVSSLGGLIKGVHARLDLLNGRVAIDEIDIAWLKGKVNEPLGRRAERE